MKMNEQMLSGMREALSLLQKEGPVAATEKIQRTLLGLMPAGTWTGNVPARAAPLDIAPGPQGEGAEGAAGSTLARLVRAAPPAARSQTARDQRPESAAPSSPLDVRGETAASPASLAADEAPGPVGTSVPELLARLGLATPMPRAPGERPGQVRRRPVQAESATRAPGRFLTGTYTNDAGQRAYKLYVPSGYRGQAVPLAVMLHGCAQGPDSFAACTRLNEIAEEAPCLVLYPAQTLGANGATCWGWFNPGDQARGAGEPSLIAGMTREVVATYGADPARVYVAGLSAGGAMAVVMAATYPELYAAVGVHSGMPYGVARDMPSALSAMRGAATRVAAMQGANGQGGEVPSGGSGALGIPIILFHGDRDETVHPSNSERILAQSLPPQSLARAAKGQAPGGLEYTRTVHSDPQGRVLAEHWLVHGGAHAWFGGPSGRFGDGNGPDASREMMRFFATHGKRP